MYVNNSAYRLVSSSDSAATSSNNQQSSLEQVINITNLPIEIIENIAFRLPEKDYRALRQTAKVFTDSLESVKSMAEEYYNNDFSFTCKGQLRQNKLKLLHNPRSRSRSLYRCITKNASAQTMSALSNRTSIMQCNSEALRIALCHHSINIDDDTLVIDILQSMEMLPNSFLLSSLQGDIFCSIIKLDKISLNDETITAIFNKADSLFTDNKSDSGLVISAMMSSFLRILSYLDAENGIGKLSDEVITSYRDAHRSMFLTGDCINILNPPSFL